MASHESYYTTHTPPAAPGLSSSSPPPPPGPQSYVSPGPDSSNPPPPTPPPKSNRPLGSFHSPNPSRTGTPQSPSAAGPPLPPNPQQTSSPRPQPPIPHPSSTIQTPIPQSQPPPLPQIFPPSLESHWLPDTLPSKPTADLSTLLSSPQLLTSLAHTHPSYAASTAHLEATIQANLELAQQLSALEAQVQQARTQSAQLLLQHTTLSTQWRRKQSEMDDALSPWGPRAMYQRLVSSINEQEALLRAVQESFLEGGDDGGYSGNGANGKASDREVGEWIRRIREGTTTLEKRREMRARWDEGRVGGWR